MSDTRARFKHSRPSRRTSRSSFRSASLSRLVRLHFSVVQGGALATKRAYHTLVSRSHSNMARPGGARPPTLYPASRRIFTHPPLLLLLTFSGLIYLSSSYPDYYTQMYASSASSCLSHPLTRYKNHGAPSSDS